MWLAECLNLFLYGRKIRISGKPTVCFLSYESDFAKHAEPTDIPKIQLIWDSLPSQLARENKKFLYSAVRDGARARKYENALNWLYNADLVRKIFCISKPWPPLSAYDD